MAKDTKFKQGQTLIIEVGALPNYHFINQSEKEESHIYTTPPIPRKSDILFADLPKAQQFWRRIEFPKIFYDYIPDVTELTDDEVNTLIDCVTLDKDRRKNGLFFMNNGEPTYITGDNYFFLQWADMLKGKPDPITGRSYPQYRKFQRDFFYFIDLCIKDNNCLGGYISKQKKVGCTQALASMYVNQSTIYEKIRCGVMSKSGPENEKINFAMIKHIIEKMPQIILPKKGKETGSEIIWGHPPTKPTGTKQYKEKIQAQKDEKVLDSVIEAVVTRIGAFDGGFYRFIWIDEISKLYQASKISPKDEFIKDGAGVKLQQQIEGKVFLSAYNPEVNDKGFLEARAIYYDSYKSTINHNDILKRTKSELYCYHISSYISTEGTFDIFGEPDVELAFKLNDQERIKAKGDVNKLQALYRQGARTSKESWNIGGGGLTVFNNGEIQKSIDLKERMDFMKQIYYKRGNLVWSGTRYRSPVVFVDDPNGKWYITRSLPENMLNQFFIPDEPKANLIPSNNTLFCGGIDPFEYKYVDEDGSTGKSKGASYTLALPNLVMDEYVRRTDPNDVFSKRIISFYSERPSDPEVFITDMILETLYFSKKVLIEENKATIVTMFKKLGLKEFLLFQNNDTGEIERFNPHKNQKQKSTQTGTVEEVCDLIDSLFIKRDGEPDYCQFIEDVELLNQLMVFDPFHTKKFDKVMAFGYALMALNSFDKPKKYANAQGIDMSKLTRALMN